MPSLATAQYWAVLPGREKLPMVCHDEPLCCPRCREILARFLARELCFDVQSALARPMQAFREDLPGASLEQLLEVRRLVLLNCFLESPSFCDFAKGAGIDDIILADEVELTTSVQIRNAPVGVAA